MTRRFVSFTAQPCSDCRGARTLRPQSFKRARSTLGVAHRQAGFKHSETPDVNSSLLASRKNWE